ncbi:hypothetical protein PENPOL_c048G07221 [Penicillium polonicum]|uniref:Uncharacterized protein n=1 Tax=Penicillium polonicum TaxID=60169 RepID=A0A1V6N5N1_PENPO|nr:hypothetical protein PENPOL_c048G07221 [Penicillium polonicum]
MPMATMAATMAEDMVNTPVVVTALATTAAKKATARPSVPSLARPVRASTVAKRG